MRRRSASGKVAGVRRAKRRQYRRPSEPSIGEAIASLFGVGPVRFDSQRALVEMLRRRLARDDPLFAIGAERLRRIATREGLVRWRVDYRIESGRPPFTRCPVCRGELGAVRNRTLDGTTVTLGRRCPACGYWSQRDRRVPIRYRGSLVRARRKPA